MRANRYGEKNDANRTFRIVFYVNVCAEYGRRINSSSQQCAF